MLITRLVLENWKSYVSATVNFTRGANAIIGENGAGKSSILEAIGYALFDARPDGFKQATLVREGQSSGRVVVSIESPLDQRNYDIERRFTMSSSSKYQVTDSDPDMGSAILANGSAEVRQWVSEHLKLDDGQSASDLFTQTIGVPQGMLTTAFGLTASARKQIFDPLLRVQEYRRAAQQLSVARRQLNERTQALAERLAYIDGQLTQQPGLLDEITALENQVAQDETLVERLASDIAQAQAQLDAMDAQQSRVQQAQSASVAAENARAVLAERLDANQRQLSSADEARTIVAASEAGHAAYLAAESQLAELEQSRQERDRILVEQNATNTNLAQLAVRLDQLNLQASAVAQAEQEMARLTPMVEQQTALEGQLSQAEQSLARLTDAQRSQKRLTDERNRRASELADDAERYARVDDVNALIATLQAKLETVRGTQNELHGKGMALKAEGERVSEQTQALEQTTAARCPVCEAELTAEHRADMIARNQAELARLAQGQQATREAYQAQIETVKVLEKELAEARDQLLQLPQQQDMARAQKALAQAEAALNENETAIISLADQAKGIQALRQMLAELGDPRAQHAVQASLASQREAVERDQTQAVARRTAEEQHLAGLAQKLAPLADLDARIQQTRASRNRHAADHEAFLANRDLAARWEALQSQAETLAIALAEAEKAFASRRSELSDAESAYDAQAHAQAREIRTAAGEQQAAAQARLGASQSRLVQVRAALAHMIALTQERQTLESEQTDVAQQSQVLQFVRDMLSQAGPHITRRKVQRISTTASNLFGDIMEDHRGRLQWSEDYELTLDVAGHERGFRQLSGGEQMSAALALRMALLQETSKLRLAFLDEPTAHMDEARRDILAERIVEVQGFDQLFVISHDDTFERLAANFIRIIKDENGSHQEGDS